MHLANIHSIHVDQEPQTRPIQTATQLSIQDALSRTQSVTSERISAGIRKAFNRELFLEQQTILIVRRRLPFNLVTWPEYRALCIALNPEVEDQLVSSASTVRQYIQKSYAYHRELLRERLQRARSCIHLASDLWTSPNRKALVSLRNGLTIIILSAKL